MSRITINDPVLGVLTWNSEYREWQGSVNLSPTETVELIISTGSDASEPGDALPEAQFQWRTVLDSMPSVRAAAIAFIVARYRKLMPEHTLSDDEIAEHLTINGVTLQAGFIGEATIMVHFDDGDLFGGHSVDVEMNPDGDVEDVLLNG